MQVQRHLQLLGLRCKDKVTGMVGVITCVSFDLYGCVQAVLHPGLDAKGELKDTCWFDIARLEILITTPVMELPDFNQGYIAEGKKGAAEKPVHDKA